jgi:hypothetical protein
MAATPDPPGTWAGHPLDPASPYAGPGNQSPEQQVADSFGTPQRVTNDPAWQPVSDPLRGRGAGLAAQAMVISREIPLVSVQTSWTISDVRSAYQAMNIGLFDQPAQMVDAIVADPRVQSALTSRTAGLLGREITFRLPRRYRKSALAQECLRAFRRAWPLIAGEATLSELQKWTLMMGFGPGQLLWDTGGKYATPRLLPWNPRYVYYHWLFRKYVALTLDGQEAINAGDGHWICHAPHGEYRGWYRGIVRGVAQPWLMRAYAFRDWARYSERHGFPIIKAITPAAGDPVQIQQFRASLATLGQESVVQTPQGVEKQYSYDLAYLEANDGNWEGFQKLIEACSMEITLALQGQNLTTEVKEGSLAAARVHADIKQALLEADARALAYTIYMQIARAFAAINFGNPDLAPLVEWDVSPPEDYVVKTATFKSFSESIHQLRVAGNDVDDINSLAADFGLHLSTPFIKVPPLKTGLGSA